MYVIVAIILLIGLTFLSFGAIYNATQGKFFKFLYHDILGWHTPNDKLSFDGHSIGSKCNVCGKRILQDSQGNWFTPSIQDMDLEH